MPSGSAVGDPARCPHCGVWTTGTHICGGTPIGGALEAKLESAIERIARLEMRLGRMEDRYETCECCKRSFGPTDQTRWWRTPTGILCASCTSYMLRHQEHLPK